MKLKLDENLGSAARVALEAAGHDVSTLRRGEKKQFLPSCQRRGACVAGWTGRRPYLPSLGSVILALNELCSSFPLRSWYSTMPSSPTIHTSVAPAAR